MSQLNVDDIYNNAGTGAANFPKGATVTGVVTATSFSGSGASLTGIADTNTIAAASLTVSGITTYYGDIQLQNGVGVGNSVTWDASANSLIFKDKSYAKFGDGSDLALYHDSSDSWIVGNTGSTIIAADSLLIKDKDNTASLARFTHEGAVKLYFNGGTKLETTNTGVTITGVTTSTTGIHAGPGILRENMRGYGSAMNGAYTADILSTGMVLNAPTNSTATFTINLRGDGSTTFNSLMNSGESTVFTAFVGQNNSSYYLTDFQIDGASITEEWAGGTAPSAGGASGTDIYTFTILKTANATFSVFANVTNFA